MTRASRTHGVHGCCLLAACAACLQKDVDVRTIISVAELRRDLCYEPENNGFRVTFCPVNELPKVPQEKRAKPYGANITLSAHYL